MRSSIRYSLLILVVVFVAAVSIDSTPLGQIVLEEIAAQGRPRGLMLSGEHPALSLTRFTVSRLSATFPKYFFGGVLDDLKIRPSFLGLLMFSPEVGVSANLYQGTLDGRIGINTIGVPRSAALKLVGVQLAEHPQISGLGITSGSLSGEVADVTFDALGRPVNVRLDLTIENVTKIGKTPFPTTRIGLPVDLVIPEFSGGRIRIVGSRNVSLLSVTEFSLQSSLVEVKGTGSCQLDSIGRCKAVSIQGEVSLGEPLHKLGSQWLPMLSNQALKPTDTKFSISVSGPINRLNPVLRPIPGATPSVMNMPGLVRPGAALPSTGRP